MSRNNASIINGKVLWNTKLYMAYCQGRSSFDYWSNTAGSVTILCHVLGSTLTHLIAKQILLLPIQYRINVVSEQSLEVGKATGLLIVLWVCTCNLPSCPAGGAAGCESTQRPALPPLCKSVCGLYVSPNTSGVKAILCEGSEQGLILKTLVARDCCGLWAALFWWRGHSQHCYQKTSFSTPPSCLSHLELTQTCVSKIWMEMYRRQICIISNQGLMRSHLLFDLW